MFQGWSPTDQNLHSESGSDQTRVMGPEGRSEDSRKSKSGPPSDLQTEFKPDHEPPAQSEVTGDLDLQIKSSSEETVELQHGLGPDVQQGSRFNLIFKCGLDQPKNQKPQLRSGQTRSVEAENRSQGLQKLRSGPPSDLWNEFRPDQKPPRQSEVTGDLDLQIRSSSEESVELQSGSRADVQPGSRLALNPESRLDQPKNLESGSRSDETKIQQSGFRSFVSRDLQHGSSSERMVESPLEDAGNFSLGSRSDLILYSEAGETTLTSETTESRPQTKEYVESESEVQSGSRSEKSTTKETRNQHASSRLDLQVDSRPDETKDFQSVFRSDPKIKSSSEEETGSRPDLESEEKKDLRPGSGSDKTRKQPLGSRPVGNRDIQHGFRLVLKPTSDVKPASGIEVKPQSRSEEIRPHQSGSSSEVQVNRSPILCNR